jgi:hypothetical protein
VTPTQRHITSVSALSDNYPHFASPFVQGLYNWQTGIGAAIALAGALLLWLQIRASKREAIERRARRFAAARATLPHILSEVVSYLELAMEWMIAAHPEVRQSRTVADPPAFPVAVIEALERMIEASSNDKIAEACAKILSDLQTFRARLLSVARASRRTHHIQVGLETNLEDYMVQAASLNYDVGLLFPFARAQQENVASNVPGTSYFGSLQMLGCPELSFANVYVRVNQLDEQRTNAAGTP